jgi:hypothetical protein
MYGKKEHIEKYSDINEKITMHDWLNEWRDLKILCLSKLFLSGSDFLAEPAETSVTKYGSRIFWWISDPDPGFLWPKFLNIYSWQKKNYKKAIVCLYEDLTSYMRSLQPPQRNSSAFKNINFLNCSFLLHFCLSGSGSTGLNWILIKHGSGYETLDKKTVEVNFSGRRAGRTASRLPGASCWAWRTCWGRACPPGAPYTASSWASYSASWRERAGQAGSTSSPGAGTPPLSQGVGHFSQQVLLFLRVGANLFLTHLDPGHLPNNQKDIKPLMSSLLVFYRVYRLEIQSVMFLFLTLSVN